MSSSLALADPHACERVHEYKANPPRLVQLRDIPSHHFTKQLDGSGSPIEFLPKISVSFDQAKIQVSQIYIQNTMAEFPSNKNHSQITQCFDISSRPIGQALKSPMNLRLTLSADSLSQLDANKQTIILMTFDNNNRRWQELTPVRNGSQFQVTVQFFGKFCFFAKPIQRQYLLTEVATSHTIASNEQVGETKIQIQNDKFDQYGAVLSVTSRVVGEADLARVQSNIGIRNVKVDQVFKLQINGNKKAKLTTDLVQLKFESKRKPENDLDKQVVVPLVKNSSAGVWKCAEASIGMGDYEIMFLETDAGNAQDQQKMEFFGGELDFVLDSSETTVYVYQHKTEKNRVHVGFCAVESEDWSLLGKNEGIVLKEGAQISYSVVDGSVLQEDDSPKELKFYRHNQTGINLYVVSDSEPRLTVGVRDSVTKQIGTILDCKIDNEDKQCFSPYIQEKIYEHIPLPEIFREYKLEHLKYLSPSERELYKNINGM